MQTEAGNTFIRTPFGDEILYEVNRDSFDRTGAPALFQRIFGSDFAIEDKLYVVIGTDSGLLPRWIAERGLPQGSRFLFIELPELIDTVRQRLTDRLDDDNLVVTTPDCWQEYAKPLRFQQYTYLDRMELFRSVGAMDAHLPEYRDMAHAIEQGLIAYRQQVRQQMGNQLFIQRQIENLADNIVPAQCLKDCCKDREAVLLGGGPSLDEIIPWIRDNRDRLLVIAVSRIARKLLALELQPDLVVSVDPQDISFDISKEMLRFPPGTLFAHAYHVSQPLLSQWCGNSVYTGDRFPWKTPLNPANLPVAGPTVTNSALDLALHMGCSTVILAGVDLCYSREGHTHATGSNERDAGAKLGELGPRVETNGGWLADTYPAMQQAIELMGTQAEQAITLGCEVINPAQGAARIPHVSHRPLSEIALSQPQGTAAAEIHRRLPDDLPGFRRQTLRASAKELAATHGRLRQILRLCDEALECNGRLYGEQADFKYKQRMDKIERRLDKEFAELTDVIKHFAAAGFLRLPPTERADEWDDERLQQWGQRYYETYKLGARLLLDHLEKAQARINSRLDEDVERPDFEQLFRQWDADESPGRALCWQQRHTEQLASLDDTVRDGLLQRVASFNEVLEKRDTRQAGIVKDTHTLAPVRSKLLWLYQQQQGEELQRLVGLLADHPDPEAVELHALAEGYLAELDGQAQQAFAHYNRILDYAADKLEAEGSHEHNPRLEDALRRMSVIALANNDADSAVQVLDVLSALSPHYEPQYAHLLRLVGRVQEAADVYTRYLERVPDDLATMLKLGRLFQDAGADDSALWAYDYVLQQDPANQAALQLKQSLTDKPASP